MLSCSCPEWDGDYGTYCWFEPNDFSKFEQNRRKRCKSCGDLIDIGSTCLEFQRIRSAYTEIEEHIRGEEIPAPSYYWCEKCGEIYFNLTAIGYCLTPTDCAIDAIEEYWDLTGFKPKKGDKDNGAKNSEG